MRRRCSIGLAWEGVGGPVGIFLALNLGAEEVFDLSVGLLVMFRVETVSYGVGQRSIGLLQGRILRRRRLDVGGDSARFGDHMACQGGARLREAQERCAQ